MGGWSSPIAEPRPALSAPHRLARGVLRRVVFQRGDTTWGDALDMTDGTRRYVRVGAAAADGVAWTVEADAAWSPPVQLVLADLLPLPDEPATALDEVTLAQVAAAGLRAQREGRLPRGEALAERTILVGGRWVVVGEEGGVGAGARVGAPGGPPSRAAAVDGGRPGAAALGALLRALAPDDVLGVADLFGDDVPEPDDADLQVLLARHLAAARHGLVQRHAAGARADAASLLRELLARLERSAPPPRYRGALATSHGGEVHTADGTPVWENGRLDPRHARALRRALLGHDGAEPLRRWLAAMSHLRVDRALLARR